MSEYNLNDREMLLMAYGALKALRPDAEIIKMLENHLFKSKPIAAKGELPVKK